MIRRFLLVFVVALLAAMPLGAQSPEFTVMAFNIRYAHSNPPNLWPDRREPLKRAIVDSGAEIVGMQEVLWQQVKDIEADLPEEFSWIGLGRDGGSKGEYMVVFYRDNRFEPLEYDHFWLSDTPDLISSRTWGNDGNARMVTWIRFRDIPSGREFYFVNTHFDHQSQPARERSAEAVVKLLDQFDSSLPVILTGDFNSEAILNPAYVTLTAPGAFRDSWTETREAEPTFGTFHGFRGPDAAAGAARIDWVLTRGPIQALDTEIRVDNISGQYPSDHFPVTARVRLR